ncbi:hypothetical protein CYY_006238 [Polysphondylium violaceum]|uniref:Zygote formation protein zyg1 n=1 Tax=Polysphondylium violaceum TaxID=133409 RepID=A0A8J4PQU9_9MYCE|nr:hypothetical protein CYY_006238 [Polysphondylium violaceum]
MDTHINNFLECGSQPLKDYKFVSSDLSKHHDVALPKFRESLPMLRAAVASNDTEQSVLFRMNQTGNIYYATSSPQLNEATKKLFDSVTVLFTAMTKALRDNGFSLFDYQAWSDIIGKSNYFVEVQKFQKNLEIKSGAVSIDTQIVQQLLPGLTGNSLDIAKNILSALSGEFSASSATEETKIGHILFICEELFGAPSITVRLFFASKKTHKSVVSSPCYKSTNSSFEQLQESNTFLFVSPDTIAEFASKFDPEKVPEEFNTLIKHLGDLIKPKSA